MQIQAQQTSIKDRYLIHLPEDIIQKLRKKRIDIIIEEATENSSQIQLQKSHNPQDVAFLRRIISFILNAFYKFLKQRDDPSTKNLENKIQEIKSLKKKARDNSKQTQVKLELKELKQLIQWQEGPLDFSTLFIKYLKSKELKSYIDKNNKIKSIPTKKDYHKAVKLVILELEKKDNLFIKFISKNTNFKDIILDEQEYNSFDSRSQSYEEESNNYSQYFVINNYLKQKYN